MTDVGAAHIEVTVAVPGVAVGLVTATGCAVGPSPAALEGDLKETLAGASAREDVDTVKKAVRDLLRHGRYKPTGRGKPASEYLLGAAREGRFPRINNLVDINNLVSLRSLLPVSMIDVGCASATRFVVRHGREEERYVFNSAGQIIELRDLLLVATLPDDRPCANPVKDSMDTKVTDASTTILAVIYAPASLADEALDAARWLGARVERDAGGTARAWQVVG